MNFVGVIIDVVQSYEKMATRPSAGLFKVVGKVADVTIFDWARVGQAGDYQDSVQRPHGIEYVIVSGEKVLDHGKLTGARPGTILRHNQC